MSITYVSKQKYLELVNEEIRKHHMYKDGMCAEFAQGADAESATGLRCGPNTPPKVLADAEDIVQRIYMWI